MFKGFKIDVPEVDVVLPQSSKIYRLRSMNLSMESSSRSSMISTPYGIMSKLNEMVYKSIADEIKPSYEEFLKNTSTKDRDALILGLYQITYGDKYDFNDFQCSACEFKYNLSTQLSKGYAIEKFKHDEYDNILKLEVPVELQPGLIAVVSQPSCKEEMDLIERISEKDKNISSYLKVRRFEYTDDTGTSVISVENSPMDFIYGFGSLFPPHKKLINKAYADNFSKYEVSVNVIHNCPECNHREEFELDFVRQFFHVAFGPDELY